MENGSKAPAVNCDMVAPDISAMHDGEPISRQAAEHIASCAACRQRAREYAEMKTELRLSATRSEPQPPALPAPSAGRIARKHGSRFLSMLLGRTMVPRAVAAMAALVILMLSVSLVFMVHAQDDGPWVRFSISLIVSQNSEERETGILQSPSMPRGSFVMRGPAQTVAYTLRTVEVRDGKALLEIGVRGFHGMIDYDTAIALIKSSPTTRSWYAPGQVLEIPVEGIGALRLVAQISETQPVLGGWAERPVAENELRLDRPLVLRGKEVILEGAGGTVAAGVSYGGALEYYVPGEGLLTISLARFADAIEGTIAGSSLQFVEAGIRYRIFSLQAIAGGVQPRRVWIHHDPSFRPSAQGGDDQTASLGAGGIKRAK